jgi:hypothetical protein
MNDEYRKMSELLDNWLSDSEKETKMAFIEKEILLEKLRKLYVKVAAMETEEYEAVKPEPQLVETAPESKKQFSPAKTLEEDVDLFFDTEHESYSAVEEDLKTIADEINEAQDQPITPGPEPETAKTDKPEPDIFDHIEEKEPPVAENTPLTDNADELFIEPDFEISAQPGKPIQETEPVVEKPVVEEPIAEVEPELVIEVKETSAEKPAEKEPAKEEKPLHAEDDILQFIPPKSKPVRPVVETPQPIKKEPEPKQMVSQTEPKKESPLQRPPQRSLNDLFIERREDHSISSQYQRAKVGDLTKAISINDKFIYIKELFHNRGEDFSAAIHQLNGCQNMEEAFNCLDELKKKFFWDSKSDAYLSFCDLLRRKYS